MLTPLIIQKGRSLDKFEWVEWFSHSHEQYTMTVSLRYVDHLFNMAEVKVEVKMFGVIGVRGLFAWADKDEPKAYTQVPQAHFPIVMDTLITLFDTEYKAKGAAAFNNARQMGLAYVAPLEVDDINTYYTEQLAKLNIQIEHYQLQTSGVPEFSPDRHSAFTSVIEDMDFEGEVDDE